jgi:hypothetical protein
MAVTTGQLFISGSGRNYDGPNLLSKNGWIIKAHPLNTGYIWMLDNTSGSTVISGSGVSLSANDVVYTSYLNLNQLDFYVESGSATVMFNAC